MNKEFIKQRNAEINAAKEITRQIDCDALALVLNDIGIMGHGVLGKKRITDVLEAWQNQAQELDKVCSNDPERDYIIEVLDNNLRRIFGEDLAPFQDRYPAVVSVRNIRDRSIREK